MINILFIIVFIVLYELFSIIGGIVMAILPNWVVFTFCLVSIGIGSSYLTKRIFAKKKISNVALYICLLAPIIGTILNIYNNGFDLSTLWYNLIGCGSVFVGLFEID